MNKDKRFLDGASGDSFFLIVVKLVTACLGFVLTRILAQTLSVTQYGTYAQSMLLVSTISALTVLGMADGTNYFFHQTNSDKEKWQYMSTIIVMQELIGLVCAAALLLLSGAVTDYFHNPELKKLLLFVAVLPMLQNMIRILQIMFVAIGKARQIAVRNLLVSAGKLVLYVFACQVLQSLAAILIFTIGLDLAQILYFHHILAQNGCKISFFRADFRLVRRISSYCIPMAVFTMVSVLNRDCDKYVVSALTDTETLALYANASKALPFDIVTSAYITVLIPYLTRYIARRSFEQAQALYRLLLEISCISMTIMAFASIAAAPMLMQLLYTEKYLEGVPVFIVYALVDAGRFLNITLILAAAGQAKKLLTLAFGSLAANLILNIVLFHCLGIVGPAIATLVVMIVTGLLIQKSSAAVMGCTFGRLFDWKYVALLFSECLIVTAAFTRLSQALTQVNYLLRLLIVGGGAGLVLLVINGRRILRCAKQIGQFR